MIKADRCRVDEPGVISSEADRSWRWYQAVGVYLPLAGGIVMLLVAAIIINSNSVPLLVIGAFWTAVGLGGVALRPRVAREVRIDGEQISFVFPGKKLTIAASEVIEIRRARGDMNRWAWLRFRTKSHGTIRVAARLRGFVDLASELRRLNPRVTYPDF